MKNLCFIASKKFKKKKKTISLEKTDQHGFKKNFSTETACLEIQTKMSNARDSGDYTLNFLRLILVKFKGLFLAHCYLYFSSHLLQTLLLQLPLWKTTTSLAVERQRKSIKETESAMKWFLECGICVDKRKTEIWIFHRNYFKANKVVLGT